ncbi:MAG TPA: ribonuclease HII, partial [Savagea sp.]
MTINEVKNYLQQDHIDDHKLTELRQDKRKGVQQLIKQYDKRVAKQAEVLSAFKEKVTFDQQYKEEGVWLVGVDEAGRGPLAGPVVTAAVCFEDYPLALLHVDDSKALTKEARNELAEVIKKHAYRYAIHFQPVSTIDELNIYEATRQSMQQRD